MKKKAIDKPLAPQIDQLASFDLTVIASVFSEDDTISQKKADISIVPYNEDDDEEALEPPQEEKQRIEKITSCRSFTLKTLKVSVVLVLVLLALVFLVVLIKSGKAFGKW